MSKIVRFHRTGGAEVLQVEDLPVRAPAEGEVQIRVRAIGLNRADAMWRSGAYVETPRLPAGLGYEAAGTVERVGPGVTGFAAGDAVSTMPLFSLNDYGMYGELVNAPARAVAHHPDSLSWEEAAAVWMQYLTAHGALVGIAGLRRGEHVLVTAASSSVGVAAIQVARKVGAVPIAVTRSAAKRDRLVELGAERVIAMEEGGLVERVREATGGAGVRVVFDPIGGPGVADLTAAMRVRGILFQYGALSPEPTPLPLFDVLAKSLTVRGYLMADHASDDEALRAAREFIVEGLARGELKPVIDARFTLDRIAEAHRYMEAGGQIGKIVVTP